MASSGSRPSGLITGDDGHARCWWSAADPDYRAYHDREWGFPVTDDRRLFEKICLEGFQAGLSWLTILRKRPAFRAAFAGFDFEAVAGFGEREITALLADAAIVRHRGKIQSAIHNAARARELAAEFGSLSAYFWTWEPPAPRRETRLTRAKLVQKTTSPGSIALSKDLKRRGWTFVGPTTLYAFMQAMGLINDHLHGCWVRAAATTARSELRLPRAQLRAEPGPDASLRS